MYPWESLNKTCGILTLLIRCIGCIECRRRVIKIASLSPRYCVVSIFAVVDSAFSARLTKMDQLTVTVSSMQSYVDYHWRGTVTDVTTSTHFSGAAIIQGGSKSEPKLLNSYDLIVLVF